MAGSLQYILQLIEDVAIYCMQVPFPDSPHGQVGDPA